MKNTILKNELEFPVRFRDCDPLNMVWHGNYLTYFEDGREAFGRAFGISYLDVQAKGFVTPIVKSVCEHKLSLRYGDIATVETFFIDSPAAKMIFQYKIYNQKKKLTCTGETVQVFLDLEGNLQLSNPVFFEEWKNSVGSWQ